MSFHMSPVEEQYLWGMVSTDGRAEHRVNQKLEGITNPPGSTLIGEASDGSEHLFQWAVVCQSNLHSARKGLQGIEKLDHVEIMEQIMQTSVYVYILSAFSD